MTDFDTAGVEYTDSFTTYVNYVSFLITQMYVQPVVSSSPSPPPFVMVSDHGMQISYSAIIRSADSTNMF
jgi:hypothetical protein